MNSKPIARIEFDNVVVPGNPERDILVEEVGNGVGFGCGQGTAGGEKDLGVHVYLLLTCENPNGRWKVIISFFHC